MGIVFLPSTFKIYHIIKINYVRMPKNKKFSVKQPRGMEVIRV